MIAVVTVVAAVDAVELSRGNRGLSRVVEPGGERVAVLNNNDFRKRHALCRGLHLWRFGALGGAALSRDLLSAVICCCCCWWW